MMLSAARLYSARVLCYFQEWGILKIYASSLHFYGGNYANGKRAQLEIEHFGKEKKKRVQLCMNHTTVLLSVIIKHLHEPDKWWHCNFDSEGTGFELRSGNQLFWFRSKLFSLSFRRKKPGQCLQRSHN